MTFSLDFQSTRPHATAARPSAGRHPGPPGATHCPGSCGDSSGTPPWTAKAPPLPSAKNWNEFHWANGLEWAASDAVGPYSRCPGRESTSKRLGDLGTGHAARRTNACWRCPAVARPPHSKTPNMYVYLHPPRSQNKWPFQKGWLCRLTGGFCRPLDSTSAFPLIMS